MTEKDSKSLQAKDKQKATAPAEQTHSGPVFTPAVDICETDKEIILLADLPGVKPKDLSIDLHDNVLTITGEVEAIESKEEQEILTEYEVGKYLRQFTISEIIDQEKIDAQLKDGVLRLILPKIAKAAPRRITIKTT